MIKYRLKCGFGHGFESWFSSSEDYERLSRGKLLTCPICGDSEIGKELMAPGVATKRSAPVPAQKPAPPKTLAELRAFVEQNAEDVGGGFAKEARAIHEGDATERPIYGEARLDEARALIEDGVPIAPLPWSKPTTN